MPWVRLTLLAPTPQAPTKPGAISQSLALTSFRRWGYRLNPISPKSHVYRVTDAIAPGVVMAPMGAWRKNARAHSTVNAVNPFVSAGLGNAPAPKSRSNPAEPAAS